MKAVINWSGGKDSAYLLYFLRKYDLFEPTLLFTFFNRFDHKVQAHLIPEELIERQAKSAGLELWKSYVDSGDGENYNTEITSQLNKMHDLGIEVSAYADLFLQDIKDYRLNLHKNIPVKPVFPIWKIPTLQLMKDFIYKGFKAIIVSIDDDKLPREFLGRQIDYEFIRSLPAGVDPAGENGEFHSFVYDGPIFNKAIEFTMGKIHTKSFNFNTIEGDKTMSLSYLELIP